MVSFPIPSSQTLYLIKSPSSCLTEDHFWGWKFLEYSYWSYLFSKTLNHCCHWLYKYTRAHVCTLTDPTALWVPKKLVVLGEALAAEVAVMVVEWQNPQSVCSPPARLCGKRYFYLKPTKHFSVGKSCQSLNYIFITDIKEMILRSGCLELMVAFILR